MRTCGAQHTLRSVRDSDRSAAVTPRRALPVVGTVLVAMSFLPGVATAHTSGNAGVGPRFVRVGAPAALPAGAVGLGATSPSTPMRVEVVLAPRNAGELTTLATAVSTPGSPQYRRYLRPGEFRTRFGATSAEIARVRAAFAAEGLRPLDVSANDLAVSFAGPAGRIEAAFGVRLPRFRLSGGGVAFANDAAPRVPARLAGLVTAVLGLDSLPSTAPAGLRVGHLTSVPAGGGSAPLVPHSSGPSPAASCTGAISSAGAGLTADQLAHAYGLDKLYAAGDTGAGATIGLVEFAPLRLPDLAAFAACYGLGSPSVTEIPVSGGPASYDGPSQIEAELDVELLMALAPSASILVYEGPNNQGNVSNSAAYDAESAAINADKAKVLSTSWGGCESSVGRATAQSENALFEQAALQGQTWLAASGDTGSEDCYGALHGSAGNQLNVDDPANQPFVTGVGGTLLSLDGSVSEVVWNTSLSNASPGAGGGGVSGLFPMPTYQSATPASLGVVGPYAACASGSGRCREVPDVAANAGTPFAIYCSIGSGSSSSNLCDPTGWTGLGGTSAAAPIWAALFALADASPSCQKSGTVGFANPALYALASGSGYSGAFSDITSGANDLTGGNGGRYPATVGYDLASGLGTPLAGNGTDGGLVGALCPSVPITNPLTALPHPSVTGVHPRSARSRGGAHVVLTGANFLGSSSVRFGGRQATTWRVVTPTRIVAVVPPGNGNVHVIVAGPTGSSTAGHGDLFGYLTPAQVTLVTPHAGSAAGGYTVVLRGKWFSGVRAVRFGTTVARFTVRSKSMLVAVAPPGNGRVDVTVVTSAGSSAAAAADRFRYTR